MTSPPSIQRKRKAPTRTSHGIIPTQNTHAQLRPAGRNDPESGVSKGRAEDAVPRETGARRSYHGAVYACKTLDMTGQRQRQREEPGKTPASPPQQDAKTHFLTSTENAF
ncbi:hypothetical protein AOLI_G00307600 [Acnodon oligacanthus]